jgi:hypothetical protein
MKDAIRISRSEYPSRIVEGFSELASVSAEEVRKAARSKFKLHSEYIPKGVRSIPNKPGQKKAAERAVRKYGDIFAAVFLRGAMTPGKSLDFMVPHEESGEKVPHGKNKTIAVPMYNLTQRSGFKTTKGRVRKRWKPKTLLKRFKDQGSRFDKGQHTTTNKGLKLGPQTRRLPGHPFIIAGRTGTPLIVRRLTRSGFRNLQFLYALIPKAQIKERWDFESTVWVTVRDRYASILTKWCNKIKGKGV